MGMVTVKKKADGLLYQATEAEAQQMEREGTAERVAEEDAAKVVQHATVEAKVAQAGKKPKVVKFKDEEGF